MATLQTDVEALLTSDFLLRCVLTVLIVFALRLWFDR